jgi:hypothetical protein
MNARIFSKSTGFSLVEVIIATALIALGLIPVFSLFVSTTSDISYTIDEIVGMTFANELIEAIVASGFDDIPGEVPETEAAKLSGEFFQRITKRLSPSKPGYERFVEITSAELPFDENARINPNAREKVKKIKQIKVIKVSVRFKQSGRPRNLRLSTILTGV